jgi:hypothetical protein
MDINQEAQYEFHSQATLLFHIMRIMCLTKVTVLQISILSDASFNPATKVTASAML